MGPSPRVDSSGWPACELCGRRLSKCKGKLHLLPPGKICSPCYKVREGYQPATGAAAPQPPARFPHGVPSPRAKRPYEELQPTQKWKRRKQLHAEVTAAVAKVGCPLEVISQPSLPPPAELIHLSTAVREAIRTVPSLHIPCEQTMINCKQLLASSHATETGTFENDLPQELPDGVAVVDHDAHAAFFGPVLASRKAMCLSELGAAAIASAVPH